jgi:hypothetical protein
MIEEIAAQKLRGRYAHVNPVLFKKSCDYAKSLGDLFDILEGLPQVYPITWNDSKRQWVTVDDVLTLNQECKCLKD